MRSRLAPKVQWLTGPFEDQVPEYRILSPKPGAPWEWVILSDAVLGVKTHFIKERTTPCLGECCPCQNPDFPIATRPKFYVAVWAGQSTPQAIGEITADAYKRCPELRYVANSLRGTRIKVYRSGDKKNSRVRINLVGRVSNPEAYPLPFDLVCALERIWFGNPKGEADQGGAGQGVPSTGPRVFPGLAGQSAATGGF